MKRIVFLLGIVFVGIVALLENSSKRKRQINFTAESEHEYLEYDDVWWDN